ncbi:hypothetical protein EV1_002540 [Malus domestica]
MEATDLVLSGGLVQERSNLRVEDNPALTVAVRAGSVVAEPETKDEEAAKLKFLSDGKMASFSANDYHNPPPAH